MLSSDPAKLPDYVGARVKKHFVGYGEFEGYVTKVDPDAKEGMPIFIRWEDGDKGWITFDEFAIIVQKDSNGNLEYKETKRKTRSSDSGEPQSKRATRGSSVSDLSDPQDNNKTPGASSAPVNSAAPPTANGTPATSAANFATTSAAINVATTSVTTHLTTTAAPAPTPAPAAVPTPVAAAVPTPVAAAVPTPIAAAAAAAANGPLVKAEPTTEPKPSTASTSQPGTAKLLEHIQQKATSEVVVHGGLVYISGQHVPDQFTKEGYRVQTAQVLTQLDSLLHSVGVDKQRLLQVRVYLRNMEEGRDEFNKAWLDWVDQDALPARTLVEAKLVREGLLVEIEAVAAAMEPQQ